MSLICEFDSISLIQLARTATPEIINQGRNMTAYFKAGRADFLDYILNLDPTITQFLSTHISQNSSLVPIPRSAPLLPNGVWPAKLICQKLLSLGFGHDIHDLLVRTEAVREGHFTSSASDRASIQEHYDTIQIPRPNLINPERIILVDDVITQGRTAVACCKRLRTLYQYTPISIFTPVITRSFHIVTAVIEPKIRKVQYYDSGKSMVV